MREEKQEEERDQVTAAKNLGIKPGKHDFLSCNLCNVKKIRQMSQQQKIVLTPKNQEKQ